MLYFVQQSKCNWAEKHNVKKNQTIKDKPFIHRLQHQYLQNELEKYSHCDGATGNNIRNGWTGLQHQLQTRTVGHKHARWQRVLLNLPTLSTFLKCLTRSFFFLVSSFLSQYYPMMVKFLYLLARVFLCSFFSQYCFSLFVCWRLCRGVNV